MDTSNAAIDQAESPTARQLLTWIGGLDHETDFWDQWFRSKGSQWPEEFRLRLEPSRAAPDYIARAVALSERTPVALLDVGSGPLTQLGSFRWDRPVQVRAVDPLARTYARLIRREGLTPPVWPETGFAEDLSAFLPAESFDIVHCCNALDHSFDPLRGIWEMLRVLRVGGTAVLLHTVNEAVNADYVGLHQWNFDLQDGRAMLWNREHRHDLADVLAPHCSVAAGRIEDTGKSASLLVYIRKENAIAFADGYKDARIRDLLTAMMDVALDLPAPLSARQRIHRAAKQFLRSRAPAVLAAYRALKSTIRPRSHGGEHAHEM